MTSSMLWVVLNWIWIASEIFISIAFRTRKTHGVIRDRGSLAILWVAIVAGMTVASWISQTQPNTMLGGAQWLKTAGIILILIGLSLRWTAILSLGTSFSSNVAIRSSQKINDTGLYRIVRHPSYLGLLFIFLAAGVNSRNWMGFAVAVLPTTAALLYRIHVEEAALRAAFGEAYISYSRTTKRLFPGLY